MGSFVTVGALEGLLQPDCMMWTRSRLYDTDNHNRVWQPDQAAGAETARVVNQSTLNPDSGSKEMRLWRRFCPALSSQQDSGHQSSLF